MSWARWRGEIAKAADGSHQTIETIEQHIREGRLTLWMDADFCLVLEIVIYPKERACQVMWAAGTLEALIEGSPRVEAWAKAQGCSEMLIEGHPGWVRALRSIGYAPWSATVRKAI